MGVRRRLLRERRGDLPGVGRGGRVRSPRVAVDADGRVEVAHEGADAVGAAGRSVPVSAWAVESVDGGFAGVVVVAGIVARHAAAGVFVCW